MGLPLPPLLHFLLLLTLASHATLGHSGEEDYSWGRMKVPLVTDRHTMQLKSPIFSGEDSRCLEPMCGIECQRNLPEPGPTDLENFLSYETFYDNGTLTFTEVALNHPQGAINALPTYGMKSANASQSHTSASGPRRRRRQVYGADGRFPISDKRFSTNYPFSTSVKLSTGCSGILVSPRHVLTAAHCINDGQGYLNGSRRLRVGIMKLRSKRGRRRGGKKGKERGTAGEDVVVGDEERNRERKRGRKRKNRVRRSKADEGADSRQPTLRWKRVKKIYVPNGWMNKVGKELALDYDYALLELKRALRTKPMSLGIVPEVKQVPAARIHFSGFDDDHLGTIVYRFCSVSDESSDLMYQHCDAQRGSSGAGVYVRLREKAGSRKWTRKVIGVFVGHQWVDVNGTRKDYNVAVRITPDKYGQICHWIHGDSGQCQTVA